jgi:DNA topoisomerase VI subunit B
MATQLHRETFISSRLLEFCTQRELVNQTGHSVCDWLLVIAKELTDNGLDASEEVGIAPEISIIVNGNSISVSDNGSGIDEEIVPDILDYNVRVSSREAYVSPTRGAQGNALKTLLAMPYALGSAQPTLIESRGVAHRILFAADPIREQPTIEYVKESSSVKTGTRITMFSACTQGGPAEDAKRRFLQFAETYAWLNPSLTLTVEYDGEVKHYAATNPQWAKWLPSWPQPAHWYDAVSLTRLMGACAKADMDAGRTVRTVREFIKTFRGFSGTAKQSQVLDACGLHRMPLDTFMKNGGTAQLLEAMRENSRPVAARDLGVIGEEHLLQRMKEIGADEGTFKYKRCLLDPDNDDGLPQVIEVAFASNEGQPYRKVLGLNFSPSIHDPFRSLSSLSHPPFSLDVFLREAHIGNGEPVTVFIHLTAPRLSYTDRGKTAISIDAQTALPMMDALIPSVTATVD